MSLFFPRVPDIPSPTLTFSPPGIQMSSSTPVVPPTTTSTMSDSAVAFRPSKIYKGVEERG